MNIFPPPNLCLDAGATALWLGGVMVGLTVMGVALLVQVGMLQRGMARMHAAWWQQMPLVLSLAWAGVCAFDAAQAFMDYRGMQPQASLLGCSPGVRCGVPLYCYPALLGGPAQMAFIGAVCMLAVGWLALSAFGRRLRAA